MNLSASSRIRLIGYELATANGGLSLSLPSSSPSWSDRGHQNEGEEATEEEEEDDDDDENHRRLVFYDMVGLPQLLHLRIIPEWSNGAREAREEFVEGGRRRGRGEREIIKYNDHGIGAARA